MGKGIVVCDLSQITQAHAFDKARQNEWRYAVQSIRLCVNDFGNRDGTGNKPEEVDLFAAQNRIMFVQAQDHAVEGTRQLDFEIGISEAID